MVGRLLKELRQREDELRVALERKEQLRFHLLHANERLVALGGTPTVDPGRESGEFVDPEVAILRRRVKVLENALEGGSNRKESTDMGGELQLMRERNEALLRTNAELELRVAELRAKTSLRDRLMRDLESQPAPPVSTESSGSASSEEADTAVSVSATSAEAESTATAVAPESPSPPPGDGAAHADEGAQEEPAQVASTEESAKTSARAESGTQSSSVCTTTESADAELADAENTAESNEPEQGDAEVKRAIE